MTLRVKRYFGAGEFLAECEPFLLRAEVENALFLGITKALEHEPFDAQRHYLAGVWEGPVLVACAFGTVPDRVGITRVDRDDALSVLAEHAREARSEAKLVLGPEPSIERFAEHWARLAGSTPRKTVGQRIHQLALVAELGSAPPGVFRAATEADLELVVEWFGAFFEEIGEPGNFREHARTFAEQRVRGGSLFLWEDGAVVSMAAWSGKTVNGVRVNFVYTPPERRGRGYATACVATLSQRLLDAGHRWVCLYTDVANPTSNAIYARIGYRPVCEASVYSID